MGYLVTQATFWCIVAAACGHWLAALTGLAVRLCAAAASMRALRVRGIAQLALVPLRDIFGFAVWCGGLLGNTVEWRGERFRVRRDGRMTRVG
jgi:ceramide glucosyltransferase